MSENNDAALQGTLCCPICQGDVVLPVHFTCFPCESSCSEDYCVCLTCARRYLGFNVRRQQRGEPRKCLFCPTLVYRHTLLQEESTCFRKNRVYMRLDPKDYKCPLGCPFEGKQLALDRHLEEQCPFRTLTCECGESVRGDGVLAHRQGCVHYRRCPACELPVHLDTFALHLREKHSMWQCPNTECPEMIRNDAEVMTDHLQRKCRYRLVKCRVCDRDAIAHKMGEHLSDHLEQSRREMCQAADRLVIAQKEMTKATEALSAYSKSTL